MSEQIYDVTAQDIGDLVEADAPTCPWCDASTMWGGAQLANGQRVCAECRDLAAEVGDGELTLTSLDAQEGGVALRRPLRVRLVVRYTADGQRWLAGLPADADAAEVFRDLDLQDPVDGRFALDGTTRVDLAQRAGAGIVDWYRALREDQALPPSERVVDEDAAGLEARISRLRRHLLWPE